MRSRIKTQDMADAAYFVKRFKFMTDRKMDSHFGISAGSKTIDQIIFCCNVINAASVLWEKEKDPDIEKAMSDAFWRASPISSRCFEIAPIVAAIIMHAKRSGVSFRPKIRREGDQNFQGNYHLKRTFNDIADYIGIDHIYMCDCDQWDDDFDQMISGALDAIDASEILYGKALSTEIDKVVYGRIDKFYKYPV